MQSQQQCKIIYFRILSTQISSDHLITKAFSFGKEIKQHTVNCGTQPQVVEPTAPH